MLRSFLLFGALALLSPRSLAGLQTTQVLYVPLAAHLPASGGRIWLSDLRLYDPGQASAQVGLTFLPAGGDNSAATEIPVTVPAGRTVLLEDVVAIFQAGGFGGIRIRSNVSLVASSSTYLASPSSYPGITISHKETVQTPAVDQTDWASTAGRVLAVANRFIDIEASASFRDSYTNVGLLNPSSEAISVVLTLFDEAGAAPLGSRSFSLPPYGFLEIVDLFAFFGASDVRTDDATLSIGATRGSPPLFEQAPVVAYAVRQTGTFDACGVVAKQADILLAQRLPD